MKLSCLVFIVVVIPVLNFGCAGRSTQSLAKVEFGDRVTVEDKQLIADYGKRYRQLLDWCGNQSSSVIATGGDGADDKANDSLNFKFDFFSNSTEYFRIDELGRRKGKMTSDATGKKVIAKTVRILRPEGMVEVGNTPFSDQLLIENIAGTKEENLYKLMSSGAPWCVCTMMGAPLINFLVGPPPGMGKYKVDSVSSLVKKGRECIQIESSATDDKGRADFVIVLDKESGVLREFRMTDVVAKHSKCAYMEYGFPDTQGSDVPPLTRYVSWSENGDSKVKLAEVIQEIKNFVPGPVELEVFDPSKLGLRVVFPKSKSRFLWVYFVVAGLVSLAVYVYARKYPRHH